MRDSRQDILNFWFVEAEPAQWFQTNLEFDHTIRERFSVVHEMAKKGLCNSWVSDAEGALALILVLDQFPRNMFRNTARAFESDEKALLVAKQTVHKGYDQLLSPEKRFFIYLPFEHSENMNDQKRNIELFKDIKDVNPLAYEHALRHKKTFDKFGRFPWRNKALGRENTPEEDEYLS